MSTDQITALLDKGTETGCVEISELNELVEALDLGDEEVASLYEQLEERARRRPGRLRARAGREHVRQRRPRPRDDGRATALPERDGPLSAADRRGGGRARQAHRARRQGGEGPDDQLEPPARRLDREEVPGSRALAARPDPGGHHRADPRRREVRLAEGVQVLDLRHVVDQAGGAARRREQGAHDPDAGAHRRPRAQDRARPSASSTSSSGGDRPFRRSPRPRSCR